jgi:hypothetical protein
MVSMIFSVNEKNKIILAPAILFDEGSETLLIGISFLLHN